MKETDRIDEKHITTCRLAGDEVNIHLAELDTWSSKDQNLRRNIDEAIGGLKDGHFVPLEGATYFKTKLEGQKRCLIIQIVNGDKINFTALYDKPKDNYVKMGHLLSSAIYDATSELRLHCQNSYIKSLEAFVTNSKGGKQTLDKVVELSPTKCDGLVGRNPIVYKINLD